MLFWFWKGIITVNQKWREGTCDIIQLESESHMATSHFSPTNELLTRVSELKTMTQIVWNLQKDSRTGYKRTPTLSHQTSRFHCVYVRVMIMIWPSELLHFRKAVLQWVQVELLPLLQATRLFGSSQCLYVAIKIALFLQGAILLKLLKSFM